MGTFIESSSIGTIARAGLSELFCAVLLQKALAKVKASKMSELSSSTTSLFVSSPIRNGSSVAVLCVPEVSTGSKKIDVFIDCGLLDHFIAAYTHISTS